MYKHVEIKDHAAKERTETAISCLKEVFFDTSSYQKYSYSERQITINLILALLQVIKNQASDSFIANTVPKSVDTVVAKLEEIAYQICALYIKKAKPKETYIRINISSDQRLQVDAHIERYTCSSSSTLLSYLNAKSTYQMVSTILNGMGQIDIQNIRLRLQDINVTVCSMEKYMNRKDDFSTTEAQLISYIDRWNKETIYLPIESVSFDGQMDYYSRDFLTRKPTFTFYDGTQMVHRDRSPDNFLIDGEIIYPYEYFENQMRVLGWKKAIEAPSKWISPENYMHMSRGSIRIVDITDKYLPNQDEFRVFQVQQAESVYEEAKVFYYKKTSTGYIAVNSNHKALSIAKKKWSLIKDLSKS